MQGSEYLPMVVFAGVTVIIGVVPVVLARLMSQSKPSVAKNAPFECGFHGVGDARIPFDVRYYLVAILFILFDIETAFLFPWAVALDDIGWSGFLGMMFFLLILVVGFIYEWKHGAIDWQ
jgi:NADH-quinone oxidoreductase subunit A